MSGTPDVALVDLARKRLADERGRLKSAYAEGRKPGWLLKEHASLVDRVLKDLWTALAPASRAALVATGGYGRGELYPSSDVDVLVLLPAEPDAATQASLERFIGLLWDVGLEIGQSVRTLEACLDAARSDITVETSLLEARLLAGDSGIFRRLTRAMDRLVDPAAFYKAKKLEQEQRHARHRDTPYVLEPNLKEAPGGLRDLQVILWIAQASGIGRRWKDLVGDNLLMRGEAQAAARHEAMLQDLRIRLHYLAGRREDRIAFDYQDALARECGFEATASRRASEHLMQAYYRNAKAVTQLNAILLQLLESRVAPFPDSPPRVLNERFQVVGTHLQARRKDVFERQPTAILESFLLMQDHRELRGMTAGTLRALWRARGRLDARLRRDPVAKLLFLNILQRSRGIVHEFRRMNQYDVLGGYLPEFGRIVGQMQHDLYHAYTVDQHILMVLRNVRRFTMPEFAHEFPLCSQLMSGFERHWLLYVAALYHDIAKGRGGDHSSQGAVDARKFCRRHGLSRDDADLVVFLVENHLTMSAVAQKQDVDDPEVARAFAEKVGTERRLIALYLLTVADIRGTSPKVWNGWKAKLLEDLFRSARRIIAGEAPAQDTAVAEKQAEATRLLRLYALSDAVKDKLWANLDTTYFLRHDPQEIAWQTRALHYRVESGKPVVRARLAPFGEGLQVMVYTPDREALFARICGFFERAGFSIVEAKIHTTRNGYALDSFLVMGKGPGTHYRDLMAMIETDLAAELESQAPLPPPGGGRVSRQVRHFPIPPAVDLRPDERGAYHSLNIVASDRPGLLYRVARQLANYKLNLYSAKVNTLGDRAEDVFLVSGAVLGDSKAVLKLERELLAELQV